jgi:membrane protease YdiL (CAAX protease family)
MSVLRRPALAIPLAVLMYAAAALAPRVIHAGPSWLPHASLKLLLAALALAAMALAGGGRARWGFVTPAEPRWGRAILRGAALGAAATVLLLVTPARGVPMLRELGGLGGIILWVWIVSSVAEEIFVRGFFQGFIDAPRQARVLASGLLFGGLHLTLIVAGADAWTVVILVAATSALGLVCAGERERTGSLWPPIATHIAFNAGSLAGGIAVTVLRKLGSH